MKGESEILLVMMMSMTMVIFVITVISMNNRSYNPHISQPIHVIIDEKPTPEPLPDPINCSLSNQTSQIENTTQYGVFFRLYNNLYRDYMYSSSRGHNYSESGSEFFNIESTQNNCLLENMRTDESPSYTFQIKRTGDINKINKSILVIDLADFSDWTDPEMPEFNRISCISELANKGWDLCFSPYPIINLLDDKFEIKSYFYSKAGINPQDDIKIGIADFITGEGVKISWFKIRMW